jgi:GTP-binding protein EngB required for normal cell division
LLCAASKQLASKFSPTLDPIKTPSRPDLDPIVTPSVIHVHPAGPLVALVGNPNCGKTALFNLLTGSRQKVANYAGVTVERKVPTLPR